MNQNIMNQLKHRAVRDLAWVIYSPPLLDLQAGLPLAELDGVWSDEWGSWLARLDAEPDRLNEYLVSCSNRLGHYFEALVLFALADCPAVEVLARQCVFRDDFRTLGECDVIFRRNHDFVLHWELAVKFYLYHQGAYLGPNVRDRLDKKCRHLAEHQLRLPHQSPIKEQLAKEFDIQQLDSQAYMRGMLFYPLEFSGAIPEGIASGHLRGEWCMLSQLACWIASHDTACRYRILPKMAWLAADVVTDESLLRGEDELLAELACHFASQQYGQMVVMLEAGELGWLEQQRCIVVADGWPAAG